MEKIVSIIPEPDFNFKSGLGILLDLEFEGERHRWHFGRLLAYVFIDRQNFNVELVREGLSPYYTRYGKSRKYDSTFRAVENFARENKKGIWGDPGPRPPPEAEIVFKPDESYFASKNSQVFHRPDCESVEKIAPGNLIEFKTRPDAIGSGRSLYKRCRP